MAARPSPPDIVVLLGEEIRRARRAADLSQDELGARVFCAKSMISMLESATRLPRQLDLIERIDGELAAGGRLLRLWEVATRQDAPAWEIDRTEAEERAVTLRTFELFWMPGLLQTAAYARALFVGGGWGRFDDGQLDQHVERRLARQFILTSERLESFHAIVDETVLRRTIGGEQVMREQLDHLLSLIDRSVITLQVLRYEAAAAATSAPMVIYDLDDGSQVAYLEGAVDGRTITDPTIIATCAKRFDLLRTQAAGLAESARMVRDRMEALL